MIIHCSAIAPLPDNEEDPVLSYETNITDTISIAEYATKIGCRNLIFLSSGAVYENDLVFPSTEDRILNTSLVYPTTKLLAEAFGRDPEFYAFIRSLKAYEGSMTGKNTTIVLNPDSEFFDYIKESGSK